MKEKKEKLRQLIEQAKQRDQEVEELVQHTFDILKESRQAIDKFIQETVMPVLEEIKGEIEADFKHVSIEQIDSSATMTMASGAKLPGESKYTKEKRYSVEVNGATRKAKGKLKLLNVVPGSGSQKDFVIAEEDITGHDKDENIDNIAAEHIWDNFLAVYDKSLNNK
ncbi:MAG: hypothetical protein WBC05_24745 [Sedimentisphaerales bacterium]